MRVYVNVTAAGDYWSRKNKLQFSLVIKYHCIKMLVKCRKNYSTLLLWIGSRHNLASLRGCTPSLQLGEDVIKARDHVRLGLLGVAVAADLSLDKHVSSVCKTCFFLLRQLRRDSRSLDTESLKTLVHAFVTSRVDYCNSVLASSPKITDGWAGIECRSTSDLWYRQLRSRFSCHGCSTMNCTGLTFLSGCSTSLPWLFTDVSGFKHRSLHSHIWSRWSPLASTYDPPDANNWMYHASAVLSVVAPLHPPVRQFGIHCRIIFAIILSDRTSFNEN